MLTAAAVLLSGSANRPLAEAIADYLGLPLGKAIVDRYPDHEAHVRLEESVQGRDVYLIQPTSPPADAHLIEFLLLADASRRAGARRLIALVPYFGYARQDRRDEASHPIAARVVADILQLAQIERLVVVDPHSPSLEGFFSIPVETVSVVPTLATAVRSIAPPPSVIVAPDLGAVRLAERYAAELDLPVALIHKTRVSGHTVQVRGIMGDVRGQAPLLVDDMITTGGTIEAAIETLLANHCRPEIVVAATHGVFVAGAASRLARLPIQRGLVTDTVLPGGDLPPQFEVVSVRTLLAETIARLHADHSSSRSIAAQ
ncbi:MAG: ribose-phosphate pyrophosphokinase [Dehalococcoidia bacterium]|nr:MAG: ribose-phosphate pyrophosphokinase [Dehalococcoidia bacterium]